MSLPRKNAEIRCEVYIETAWRLDSFHLVLIYFTYIPKKILLFEMLIVTPEEASLRQAHVPITGLNDPGEIH